MKNNDIRGLIVKEGLYVYEVAAAMNVKANTLSVYLMRTLTKSQKERIKAAIKTAKSTRKAKNEQKTKIQS